MSVAIGRIRGGQVVIEGEGEPLPEGRRVAVVIDDEEGFRLDAGSQRELVEAMAEIERGEWLTGEQLEGELRA